MRIPLSSADLSQGRLSKISHALVRVLRPARSIKLSRANEVVAKMLGYTSFHDAQNSEENVVDGDFKSHRNLLFSSYPMPLVDDILKGFSESLGTLSPDNITGDEIVNQLPIKALDFFRRASMKCEVTEDYLGKLEECYFQFAYAVGNLPIEDQIQSCFYEITNFRDCVFLLLKDSSEEECNYALNKMTIKELLELEVKFKEEDGSISEGTAYETMFLPAHLSAVSSAIGFNPPPGLKTSRNVPSEFFNEMSEYLKSRWMDENIDLKGRSLFQKKPGIFSTFEKWDYRGYLDKGNNYKRFVKSIPHVYRAYQESCDDMGVAYNWDYCLDVKVGRKYVPKVFLTGNIFIGEEYCYSDLLESITRDEYGVNSAILCEHLSDLSRSVQPKTKNLCKKIFDNGYMVTISNLEGTRYCSPGDVSLAVTEALEGIKAKFGIDLHLVVYAAPPEYSEWVPHNDLYPIVKEKRKAIAARKKYLRSNIPDGIAKSITLVEPYNEDRKAENFRW